jgi:hypothetical protein
MQGNLSKELEQKLSALEMKLTTPLVSEHLISTTKEIGQATQSIKDAANEMGKSIVQVTDTSSQIATSMTNYKDTILKSNVQQPQPRSQHSTEKPSQVDPKVIRDVDRKTRQILIDTRDDNLLKASLTKIKEKVCTAINAITNPPPTKDMTVLEISKLCKGGFMVLFKEKEIVDWLQDTRVEFKFTSVLAEDALITKHTFFILVPHIPLTFNLTEEGHLREVEECNKLPAGTIVKARWIKPAYRRTLEQRAAHAIFALKDVMTANICIRDSIYVCRLWICPSRLKHKPMQCMKCKKWGHFTNACMAMEDTCGTCGGKHRTNECTVKDKTHCVSCKSDSHTSWDRGCLEFQHRCAQPSLTKTTQKTISHTSLQKRNGC